MIIDRQWNKKEQKLVISYVDKLGNRQFYQKYLHHFKTYEFDDEGEFDHWDGRKCRKVFKDTLTYDPNEFDILEFMYEMDPEMNKLLHAQYFPKLYTFDIETEVSLEFPDPEKAEQKVTSISLVGPDMSCIVYGLHKLTEDQIGLLRKRYLDWIEENEFAKDYKKNKLNNKEPKVLYQYFETEEDLLKHFFTKIIQHIPALAGWNSYRFDWMYLWNRIVRLFGKGEAYSMMRKASPTGELSKISWSEQNGNRYSVPAPLHVAILDYMELVKQYDYVLVPYESYSLDWVGNAAVKAHKIKYKGTLQQLYERDPEWYYFYNAVDSLIVNLIHRRLKSLESPCAAGSVTLVPLIASMGQVALTTANVFWTYYCDHKHVVWDYDAIERTKVEYEGAFCGCVPGRYEWNVCDDFASLYPSQVQTCNLSFENLVYNKVGPDDFGRYTIVPWTEAELEEKRKDPNYFVSVMGNVYKNDQDYCFKKMQRRTKQNRDFYKYTGQRLESQVIAEIERITENKPGDPFTFSEDVVKLLEEEFGITSLDGMTNDELLKLKIQVRDLRDEYWLLEMAMKALGNAAYGAAANRFFYFYNIALAGDITGECRNLTKTMWKNLEDWFHEGIWERKDLWEKFSFELDEAKHDWYRKQAVSIYSDTDSVYTTFGTFFEAMTKDSQARYNTDNKKLEFILKYSKEFQDKLNTKWCEDIYNPRHGHNIHEFELETVSKAGIYLKKKKYLKGLVFNKGKYLDHPKVSGTGIELIKSTTPKLCRKILKDLMEGLMFDYEEKNKEAYMIAFNQRLAAYRKEFYNAPIEDISQSIGVGDYKKYVIDDEDNFELGKQCPVSVQAVARFNYMAHKHKEDNKKIYSGKIKYYNIYINEKTTGYFGFQAGELPDWAPPVDKLTQWKKTVIDPINRFLEVMNIPLANPTGTVQLSLFD